MFYVKSLYCRVFQLAFKLAMPLLPYRDPQIVTSCSELGNVFAKERIKSVLIVTDKGIVNNGLVQPLEKVLQTSGVSYQMDYRKEVLLGTQINVYHTKEDNLILAKGLNKSGDTMFACKLEYKK